MAYTRHLLAYLAAAAEEAGPEAHGTAVSAGTAVMWLAVAAHAAGTSYSGGSVTAWLGGEGDARLTQVALQFDSSAEVPVNVTQAGILADVSLDVPANVTQAGAGIDVQRIVPANVTQAGVSLDVSREVPARVTAVSLQVEGYVGRPATVLNCWEVHVYDRIDQYICQLDNASNVSYIETKDDAGGGSFDIYANDAKVLANSGAALKKGNIVRMRYRNTHIGAWVIENNEEVVVGQGEVAARVNKVSGRGLIGLLDKALVYPANLADPNTAERAFDGKKKAEIFISLWNEFILRGGGDLHLTFNTTYDTDGQAWSDSVYLKYKAGQTMLEVMRQLAALGLDFIVRPDRRLDCYQALGDDLTLSVIFRKAWNMLECTTMDEGHDLAGVVLAEGQGLFIEATDTTSIGDYGRREAYLSVGNTADSGQLSQAASLFLTAVKNGQKSIKCKLTTTPHFPFFDYKVGDTVKVVAVGEFVGDYRILGIAAKEAQGPCDLQAEVELNSVQNEFLVRLDKAFRSSLAGIAPNAGAGSNLAVSGTNTSVAGGTGGGLGTDAVKDTHVDWGTGAAQVGADDMPIVDAGNLITATTVEGALAELAQASVLITGSRAGATAQAQQFASGVKVTGGGLWLPETVQYGTVATLGTVHSAVIMAGTLDATVNLPAASGLGGRIYIIKSRTAATIAVHPAGADTIDATPGDISLAAYEVARVMSDGGTDWLRL
jgi:hypothetical protein